MISTIASFSILRDPVVYAILSMTLECWLPALRSTPINQLQCYCRDIHQYDADVSVRTHISHRLVFALLLFHSGFRFVDIHRV